MHGVVGIGEVGRGSAWSGWVRRGLDGQDMAGTVRRGSDRCGAAR